MSEPDVYEAVESFVSIVDGAPVTVTKGTTRVRKTDPLYRLNPHFFKPLTVRGDEGVEKAVAEPGTKRHTK